VPTHVLYARQGGRKITPNPSFQRGRSVTSRHCIKPLLPEIRAWVFMMMEIVVPTCLHFI
jgi:hypothetical protein